MLCLIDYIGLVFVCCGVLELVGGKVFLMLGVEIYDLVLCILDVYGEVVIGYIIDVFLYLFEVFCLVSDGVFQLVFIWYLEWCGVVGKVLCSYLFGIFYIDYLYLVLVLVMIIIFNKNKFEFFYVCFGSLLDKIDYLNYDVIVVDNQSSDLDFFDYYEKVIVYYLGKVYIFDYLYFFNYLVICN